VATTLSAEEVRAPPTHRDGGGCERWEAQMRKMTDKSRLVHTIEPHEGKR
jgi:hypothetical protein